MGSLRVDIRSALRMLVRQPWTSLAIVCTLALGIGTATAAYAVFNDVLFRPVPGVAAPPSLVTVRFSPPEQPRTTGSVSREALPSLQAAATGLEYLAEAYTSNLIVRVGPTDDSALRDVEFVSRRYLQALGVRARAGRLLTDPEAEVAGHDVALISDRMWKANFDRDISAIGGEVIVGGRTFSIVGVVDKYRGWGTTRVGTVDVWLPRHADPSGSTSNATMFELVGRLRAGSSPSVVQDQLRAGLRQFTRGAADQASDYVPVVYPGLEKAGTAGVRRSIMTVYPFLVGGAGLLLLLTCANATNLLLARMAGRSRDIAVQAAIGASRGRVLRGLLLEAAALAVASSGLGIVLASLLLTLIAGGRLFELGPAATQAGIDWRVTRFALLIAGMTVLLFGLLPATSASRVNLRPLLQHTGTPTPRGRRLRLALAGLQIALSIALLAGAGVLVRSLQNLRHVDLGMQRAGVISFKLNPRLLGYKSAAQARVVRSALEKLDATPGVASAAYASPSAFNLSLRSLLRVRTDPGSADREASAATGVVSGAYFETLGIPLLAGRTFTEAEFQREPGQHDGVAIASAALARRLFGEEPAVGRRVALGGSPRRPWKFERDVEIVGVVGDTRSGWQYRDEERPAIYESGGQVLVFGTVYVKSAESLPVGIAKVRGAMRELAPNLPLEEFGTLQDEIERVFPEERALAKLSTFIAIIATLIALAGVYAVLTCLGAERTREFGIRLALGATRGDIAGSVLRVAGGVCVFGTGAGLAFFAFGSTLLESRVYGITPLDPATLVAVVTILSVAALAAAWRPARRATLVDPVEVLRE